jgi:hypothetical protein
MSNDTQATTTGVDTFGVQGVSGFYGPGSWIAYTLTLATSWVAVIRNDQSHNLHHIGYLLYVNWAAIDAIRHSAQAFSEGTESGTRQLNAIESRRAALLVSWWGVCHIALQYTYAHTLNVFANSLFKRVSIPISVPRYHRISGDGGVSRISDSHQNSSAHNFIRRKSQYLGATRTLGVRRYGRRRRRILELGVLLPAIAGLVESVRLFYQTSGEYEPWIYWHTMNPRNRKDSATLYRLNFCTVGLAFLLRTVIQWIDRLFKKSFLIPNAKDVIGLATVGLIFVGPQFTLPLSYIFRLLATGGAIWTKSSVFMPCAPQSLLDWDQAFAAIVSVIMVGYEFGPAAWRRVRVSGTDSAGSDAQAAFV